MATTEQFSLRWNNFHSNMTTGFHDLFEASDMVDVTLAIDGQFLQAHKIVLSICSPYFKEMFKINPCKHPIVILKDISHENMKDILNFMYLGEVNVLRENLPSFLRTAELLQVKGLTGDDSSDTSSRKGDKAESIGDNDDDQDIQSYSDLMEEPIMNQTYQQTTQSRTSSAPQKRVGRPPNSHSKRVKSDYNSNQSTTMIKQENTQQEQEDYDCDYTTLENHVKHEKGEQSTKEPPLTETQVPSTPASTDNSQDHGRGKGRAQADSHPFKCDKCVKRFSRRDHLRTHEKNIHGEDAGPFACIICSQLYKNSESLRKHIAKFHYQKGGENSFKVLNASEFSTPGFTPIPPQ